MGAGEAIQGRRLFLDLGSVDVGAWYHHPGIHERWQDLGAGVVLTIAKQEGYPFDSIALPAIHSWAEFRTIVKNYDLLTMNVRNWRMNNAVRAARIAKSANPKIQIWVGGFHTSIALDEVEAVEEFDLIVTGQADITWRKILQAGGPPSGSSNRVIPGDQPPFGHMDDTVPWIDREVWPHVVYYSQPDPWPLDGYCGWGPGPKVATTLTSRGCPFTCLTADTEIQTENGVLVPIASIAVGTKVWGVDISTGRRRIQTVLASEQTHPVRYDIIKVQVDSAHSLHCTSDHRIYTRRGWVAAGDLTIDDEVLIEYLEGLSRISRASKYLTEEEVGRPRIPTADGRTAQLSGIQEKGTRIPQYSGICEGDERPDEGEPASSESRHTSKDAGDEGYSGVPREDACNREGDPRASGISPSSQRANKILMARSIVPGISVRSYSRVGLHRTKAQTKRIQIGRKEPSQAPGGKREDPSDPSGQAGRVIYYSQGYGQREVHTPSCHINGRESIISRTDAAEQPNEASGNCSEGRSSDPSQTRCRPSEICTEVCSEEYTADTVRIDLASNRQGHAVSSRRQRAVLGRSVSQWEVSEPRLYLQRGRGADSSFAKWRILAQRASSNERRGGDGRLCGDGISSIGPLGFGVDRSADSTHQSTNVAGWAKVLSITPLNSGLPVYDLETFPDHNFFANGILVHNCKFCYPAERIHYQQIRRRSVGNTIEELQMIEKRWGPVNSVVFHDAEFFMHPRWLEEFLERYPRETPRWPFWGAARADMILKWPDIFSALVRDAGWHSVSIGLESGSDRVLDILGKGTTRAQNDAAIELVNRLGDEQIQRGEHPVKVFANMMQAIPGETREDAFETIRMFKQLKRAIPSFAWYTPSRGNTLGEQIRAEGRALNEISERFPGPPKVQGVDYQFYTDLMAGRYNHEVGLDVPAMMRAQGGIGGVQENV